MKPKSLFIISTLASLTVTSTPLWAHSVYKHTNDGITEQHATGDTPHLRKEVVNAGVFRLENTDVRNYLSRANYKQQGYASQAPRNIVNDHPLPVILPLPADTTAKLVVYITKTQDDYTTAYEQPIDSGANSSIIFNLEPSCTYYYKICADYKPIQYGTFNTTGLVRMIKTENGSNIRDIGGRITTDGHRVRYGRLFRGSELRNGKVTNVTDTDIRTLQTLGIKAELDLRSSSDIDGLLPDSSCLGGEYTFVNLRSHSTDICSQPSNQAKIKQAFSFMAQCMNNGKPVYMHCTWGADRTGIMAFFVECALGFTLDDLYKDYELTSLSKAGYRAANSPTAWSLEDKIGYIQSHFNGRSIQEKTVNFLREACGVTDEELSTIRNFMLEEDNEALHKRYEEQKAYYDQIIALADTTWHPTTADETTNLDSLQTAFDRVMNALTYEVDLTPLLQNPTFDSNPALNGWIRQGTGIQYDYSANSASLVESNSLIRQSISDLPRGQYILKIQGWQTQKDCTTDSAYSDCYIALNNTPTTIHPVTEDAQNNILYNAASETHIPNGLYIPNNAMASQAYYKQGLYWNVATCSQKQNGLVEIRIIDNDSTPGHKVFFDNVRLFYRGQNYQPQTLIIDNVASLQLPESDSYMAIRTSRTLQPECWNSLCLPFDMSGQDMKQAHITQARQFRNLTLTNDSVLLALESVNQLHAGIPYLVQVDQPWTIESDSVLVRAKQPISLCSSDAEFTVSMTGTYTSSYQPNVFLLQNDAFVYHADYTNTEPLSAYICADNISENIRENGFPIEPNKGNATRISQPNVKQIQQPRTQSYDLGGYRLYQPLPHHIYIRDGKKILK